MPFKMGFISLSKVEDISPEVLKMFYLLGTCHIPMFLMSSEPKESTMQHLRKQHVDGLFELIILGAGDQVEIILNKLSRAEKPPLRQDVFYLSDQPAAIESARKIGISAFRYDANSASLITSHLRVNM
jgi:phosphoglycolate phosphatase-like HAD superfamily hydrolase